MAIDYPTDIDAFGDVTDDTDTFDAVHLNDLRRAIEELEGKTGVDSSKVDTSIAYKVDNFYVENTRFMYFWENTAPTGWTIDTTCADCVLAIKGGAQDYNVSGSTKAASSWTDFDITAHAAHNHKWFDFIDATNEHSITYNDQNYGGTWTSAGAVNAPFDVRSEDGWTANSAAFSHAGAGTWRPPGGVGIIAEYTGA